MFEIRYSRWRINTLKLTQCIGRYVMGHDSPNDPPDRTNILLFFLSLLIYYSFIHNKY